MHLEIDKNNLEQWVDDLLSIASHINPAFTRGRIIHTLLKNNDTGILLSDDHKKFSFVPINKQKKYSLYGILPRKIDLNTLIKNILYEYRTNIRI